MPNSLYRFPNNVPPPKIQIYWCENRKSWQIWFGDDAPMFEDGEMMNMDTTGKTVTRVRIEHSDGTYIELTDPDGCKRWKETVDAHAGIAFAHGTRFEPLPWIEGTRNSENDE